MPNQSQRATMIVAWGAHLQFSQRLYLSRSHIARKPLQDLQGRGETPKVPPDEAEYKARLMPTTDTAVNPSEYWDDDFTYLRGRVSTCSSAWSTHSILQSGRTIDCPIFHQSSSVDDELQRSDVPVIKEPYTHTGYEELDAITLQPIFKYDEALDGLSPDASVVGARVFVTFGASCLPDPTNSTRFRACYGCRPRGLNSSLNFVCDCDKELECTRENSPHFRYGAEFSVADMLVQKFIS